MPSGSVFKRCPCGTTGTPGKRACRQEHGTWWWRADAAPDPATGRRRQPAQGGYKTKPEAQEALTAYLAARDAGTWADDRRITVADWLRTWIEESRGRLEPKTLRGYEGHVETVLIPQLGHLRLRDLRRHHVENLLRELGKPGGTIVPRPPGRGGRVVEQRSPRTLDSYRRTLRAALAAARRRGLVAVNVAEGRIDALPSIGRADTRWWEPDQVGTFLQSVQRDRLVALYELAAFAGLRRGELLGLRWIDVDLASGTPGVVVAQTLSGLAGQHPCTGCGGVHTGRRIKPGPKTDAGRRWVPLVGGTVRELLAHQAAQAQERSDFGRAYVDHGLVFAMEDGVPLRPDTVTHEFEARAAAAGLPPIRLHDMRHGAASLLLAAGVPIELVALILGHASPAVTRDVYAHVLKDPARKAMQAAEALVRREANP